MNNSLVITTNIRRNAFIYSLLITFVYLFYPSIAEAAVRTEFGSASGALDAFKNFVTQVGVETNKLLTAGSDVALFVNAEFITFTVYRLSIAIAGWALGRDGDLINLFSVVALIAIVQILLEFYDDITSLLFVWANDFAGAIQVSVTGDSDVFYASSAISEMMDSLSLTQTLVGVLNPLTWLVWGVLAIFITLLNIVAFFGTAWAVWGYGLAKLIGWFFIPFMLIEKLSPLFDGWIKFLVGFLLYGVIVRVNMVLIVILLKAYFGYTTFVLGSLESVEVVIDGFSSIGGLLAMLFIAILSILSTGTFATSLAGGVGGFGQSVIALARVAGGSARAFR